MSDTRIRIGLVGAGANTRLRHIPGFRALPGVEIVAVANRSRASGEAVAREFGIPRVYDQWGDIIRAEDVDAVCIGTWPNLHCPVTLAALENGKHVLTEARMAMNAAEARAMLAAAKQRPDLVTQVVPAPFTLEVDGEIQRRLADGCLGRLLAVELQATSGGFANPASPLHWRQDIRLSGFNTLTLGIWYECLMRWVGPARSVAAMMAVCVRERTDADGKRRAVEVPDHVEVLAELEVGAIAHMRFSAVTGLDARNEVWLYGAAGTLKLEAAPLRLSGGRPGDRELREIAGKGREPGWRVEEEFANAIRGKEKVVRTTFEDGVRYMEFTEAVARSAKSGRRITLPIEL
jgi:predicted dehydrogenase